MEKYIPFIYKKNIYDIPYEKLRKLGVKCLMFDLDNTVALISERCISEKVIQKFNDLKKDFHIVIISNNTKKRVSAFCEPKKIEYVYSAMKPFSKGFRVLVKKYGYTKKEMCIIGDQLMTDILGGNLFGIYTVLVDPLGEKDLKITSFNRFLERKKLEKLSQANKLERGKYYG